MEHFRYVLIASQLLNEYIDYGSAPNVPVDIPEHVADESSFVTSTGAITNTGLIITAGSAFFLAGVLNWARGGRSWSLIQGRAIVLLVCALVTLTTLYAFLRHEWRRCKRHQVLEATSAMVTNVKAFEATSTSALSMIQEVELVSKGYRLSHPLPPISRLEDAKAGRKCATLRRHLHRLYIALIRATREGLDNMHEHQNQDDFERFLDVYEVSREAIYHASSQPLPSPNDETDALGYLRMLAYQLSTLRRALLCSLLSLDGVGTAWNITRWRAATEMLYDLSQTFEINVQSLRSMLRGLEGLCLSWCPHPHPY